MKTQQRIMVIDDDPVVGKSFEKVLTSKGYAVINCHSGAEALEKLGKEEYDAVFTDLKMPEMDGMEVATRVRASQPWMPIVIVTGYGSKENRIQAETLGITDFMHKPLTPEMIEASADRAMLVKQSIVDVVEEVAITPVVEKQQSKALAIALFLAAPFIGLLYAMFMPIVGLGMLAYVAYKAFAKTKAFTYVKNVGLLISAPFIGLAYAVALPFVGIGMLLYVGGKAAFK